MSRSSGRNSFADFFPTAPSVLEEKKRQQRERQKLAGLDTVNGLALNGHQSVPSPARSVRAANGTVSSAAHHNHSDVAAAADLDDKPYQNGDSGDMLNGVGSASSLNSTASSVFSTNGNHAMPMPNGAGAGSAALTPLTNHETSPPERSGSPGSLKSTLALKSLREEYQPDASAAKPTKPAAQVATPTPTPNCPRPHALPPSGEYRGLKCIYDPALDSKLTSEEKKFAKPRYQKIKHDERLAPPPDPRLAIPGYRSGVPDIKLGNSVKVWKCKARQSPYTLLPYKHEEGISIGPPPASAIVVTGFDPFTPNQQIRTLFGFYGEIAELDNKTDPNNGTFLGICFIRYRDSRARHGVKPILAIDAAKEAVEKGSNQRLGVRRVKAELDSQGRKCARYVEYRTKKNVERREREFALEEMRRPAPTPPAVDLAPIPPPNAPKGPSSKAFVRLPEGPKQPAPPKRPENDAKEDEPILPQIGRKPYVFIPGSSVPIMGHIVNHMKKRMRMYEWEAIRLDDTGYYVIFPDSKRGEDEAVRCSRGCQGQPLFNYTMEVECQQYGNPNWERSPSPERVIAEKKKQEEEEALRKEEEADVEEEKKRRAIDLDPVKAAMEQIRTELKDRVFAQIKRDVVSTSIYDYLAPQKHAEKRRELGIDDPEEQASAPALLAIGVQRSGDKSPSVRSDLYARNRSTNLSISRIQRETAGQTNAFIDERRQHKRPMRYKLNVTSLTQRLENYYEDDGDSDDERKTSRTRDTDDVDSQSVSRMSSVPPVSDAGDDLLNGTPRKRRRLDKHKPLIDDSDDEGYDLAKTFLDPHLLKKEVEDMAVPELQQILSSIPSSKKLHQRAKDELEARLRARRDDKLFQAEQIQDGQVVGNVGGLADEDMQILDSIESAGPSNGGKQKKGKKKAIKKTKKQLFEEREAAKAQMQIDVTEINTEDAADVQEEPEAGWLHPHEEEEWTEANWAKPRLTKGERAITDDPNVLLDIDGWQETVKDDEDLKFLKEALASNPPAEIDDAKQWAFTQKEIKELTNGGFAGKVREPPKIQGYYVPNATGSARTEGIRRIMEDEKSQYLTHRIKVAELRKQRQETAKDDPSKTAAAVKQAKAVSSAIDRNARAEGRGQRREYERAKQAQQEKQHERQDAAKEDQKMDEFRYNQLLTRRKRVRFDRSAIHGWGLYAEQDIAENDFIIEYVGEKIRKSVASVREVLYDKQGMGDSYLFRIDDDYVVDATKKGGIARFINHSCSPTCKAKIIELNGTKRIVIYALKEISKNDELTYDYKFEREIGNENRVPCLCGSENCKGFLN